jgi:hypothetical protein
VETDWRPTDNEQRARRAAGCGNVSMGKRWRQTVVRCLCTHPLAPDHAHDAHEGKGVTAALTDHPWVDMKRDSACLPRPDAQPVTFAEPTGLRTPFNCPGVRKNLLDGGAMTVRGEKSRVVPVNGLIHAARLHVKKLYTFISGLTIA